MNDKEMFDNWMKKKEEIQLRIERTDKMVKDREKEITLLENQISYLEETIDSFMDEPDIVIKKLQAEKAELQGQLKSCIVVYEEQKYRLIEKLKIAVEALRFYADGGRFYDIANEALEKINED